ncbi:MAG: MMPL family transporter, partial [Methylomicrobium sp.]|nr:MMPL family transporter [Methylomicrobium sp.]
VTGIAMMNSAFVEAAMNDNMTLVPLMYGIVIVLLLLTLRSVSATVSVVLLILFTITSSLGLFGWFGWHLNPTSAVASTIILTIAVADCIHVLAAFLHAMQQGLDKRHAIQEALRINFKPIALTSLTTTIGFLSMNFSDAPPFRELGNIVAVGVVIALVLTLTLLPALMVLLPVKIRLKTPREKSSLSGLANWVVRWRKPLLLFNTFLGVVLAGIAFNNELNDDFVKYFDETVEFRRATDFLNQNLGGIYSIEVALDTGSEGGISEPLLLRQIDQLVGWLYLQPEVVHVHSITDTFKRLNKNMHSDDNSAYSLPEHRELAAQYLLMYEMSLPYGLDLNDQITIDKSGLRLIITLKSLSTNQILDVEQRINQWVRDHMPEIGYQMASTTLMFSHIGKRNIKSMIFGAFIALGFISLLLVFAFRSIKLGFISLVPNLAPAAMAFGVWALIDGQVGLGLSVVTSITLGIVVDDTIHFISKYRHARVDKGLSSEEAVRYAFSTVGIAIWMTSVVLACGFFVLSFSQFTVNAQMGLLTAITIAIALLMDLLLLPPLLMVLDRK